MNRIIEPNLDLFKKAMTNFPLRYKDIHLIKARKKFDHENENDRIV